MSFIRAHESRRALMAMLPRQRPYGHYRSISQILLPQSVNFYFSQSTRTSSVRHSGLIKREYGLSGAAMQEDAAVKDIEYNSRVVILRNSKDMAHFISTRCLTIHKNEVHAGLNHLATKIVEMQNNPPTRQLTLSRLSLKSPADFSWFSNWLWPLFNGKKDINDAFPVSIDTSLLGDEAEMAVLVERLRAALQEIDANREELLPKGFWGVKRVQKLGLTWEPNPADPYDFLPAMVRQVPTQLLENLCSHLEAFHRGEINQYYFHVKIKKMTVMHTELMLPLYYYADIENDQYLYKFFQASAKKQRDINRDIQDGLDSLFEKLREENQQRLHLENMTPEERRSERERERESKLNDEKRKYGTKHELFVTLRVERIEGEEDFGADDALWKAAREQPVTPGVSMQDLDGHSEGTSGAWSQGDANDEDVYDHQSEEYDEKGIEDFCSSERKVFIENIPEGIDEKDIASVLRNCGEVKRIWLHRSDTEDEIEANMPFGRTGTRTKFFERKYAEDFRGGYVDKHSRPSVFGPEKPHWATLKKEEKELKRQAEILALQNSEDMITTSWKSIANDEKRIMEELEATGSDEGSDIEDMEELWQLDADRQVGIIGDDELADRSLHPADESSDLNQVREDILRDEQSKEAKTFERKAANLKKRVARTQRNYSYAYVLMADSLGYSRITRDEMRIFGVCINGHSCRIQEAERLRTLIVEFSKPLTCDVSRNQLSALLGPWHSLTLPQLAANRFNSRRQLQWSDVAKKKPVFIHLEFPTHAEAWKSFDVLSRAAAEDGAPLKVNWVKSKLYWKVACKAKEIDVSSRARRMTQIDKIGDEKTVGELRSAAKVSGTTLEQELESSAYGSI